MSEKIDTKEHPVIKALEAHRLRLNIKDRAFAHRLTISPSSWSTLRSGTDGANDPTPMLTICEGQLRTLEEEAEHAAHRGHALVELREQKAVLRAIERAAGDPRDRFVPFITPTGGGKTTLAHLVAAKYPQTSLVIEATETWRTSYFAALLSFARAMGVAGSASSARTVEAAVLEALARSPRIVVIDEAHYCGREAINLVKLILNDPRVRTRVVMLAIPQLWAQMTRANAEEMAQLRNRTLAKIVLQHVSADDCRAIMAAQIVGYAALNGDEKRAVSAVAEAANRFGLLNTVRRICKEIAEVDESLCLDAINSAIKRVEALRS